jgi:hypothetical protein
MGLAENDDMIQALTADRPDQPFGKALARWHVKLLAIHS